MEDDRLDRLRYAVKQMEEALRVLDSEGEVRAATFLDNAIAVLPVEVQGMRQKRDD